VKQHAQQGAEECGANGENTASLPAAAALAALLGRVRDGVPHTSRVTGAPAAAAGPAHYCDDAAESLSSSNSDDREEEQLDVLHRTALHTLAFVADRRVEVRARRGREASRGRAAAAAAALQAAFAAAKRSATRAQHVLPAQGAARGVGSPYPQHPAYLQGLPTPSTLQADAGTTREAHQSATSGYGEQVYRTNAGFSTASEPVSAKE
jgi:hypothetical protein